jgi:hypothetical protein
MNLKQKRAAQESIPFEEKPLNSLGQWDYTEQNSALFRTRQNNQVVEEGITRMSASEGGASRWGWLGMITTFVHP